jgi:hypothetical protein
MDQVYLHGRAQRRSSSDLASQYYLKLRPLSKGAPAHPAETPVGPSAEDETSAFGSASKASAGPGIRLRFRYRQDSRSRVGDGGSQSQQAKRPSKRFTARQLFVHRFNVFGHSHSPSLLRNDAVC